MAIFFSIFLFVLGLFIMILGGNLFVDDSISLAKKMHISEIIIGATIVSIGTTLPEVLFSTTAAFQGMTDASIGNAIGSIICNTGFIAGISMAFQTLIPSKKSIKSIFRTYIWFCFGIILFLVIGVKISIITRGYSILYILFFIMFMYFSFQNQNEKELLNSSSKKSTSISYPLLLLKITLDSGMLFIGAKLLVLVGPNLARFMGVPEIIISLTFIALGTSLPELITAITALYKKQMSLSFGNILGANFINISLVTGLSAFIHPIKIPNRMLIVEFPLCAILLSIMCLPTLIKKKTFRFQGFLLLLCYTLYIIKLFFLQ